MQVVSGFGYIITYEKVRHILSKNDINDNRIRGLIAGGLKVLFQIILVCLLKFIFVVGCGSLVSQTIICMFST